MSTTPDKVIALLPVSQCEHCQRDLRTIAATHLERRQVVDVPLPRLHVTEYQGKCKCCPGCHGSTRAVFPERAVAPVQYGPRVGAIGVSLVIQQFLPWSRSCHVLWDLLGVQMSEGAVQFCRIRGYLSTLRKQGLHVFSALQATLCGQPLLSSFSET